MSDEQHCLIRPPHDCIDPCTHGTQRIDVEAAIRLVQYSQLGIKDAHLHHFIALLLSTRKADIHGALQHIHVELQQRRLFLGKLDELPARKRLLVSGPALAVEAFPKELQVRTARNFDRIFKAQEKARSEERRVGKECVSPCRSRWSTSH